MDNQRFVSTIDYDKDPRWAARARTIRTPASLLDEGRVFVQILQSAIRESVLLLDSSAGRLHPDLLASIVIRLFPKRFRPVIILSGCMWQRSAGLPGKIQALLVRLADPAIQLYAIQSTEELQLFPSTWGVSSAKMRLCPYFFTIHSRDSYDPEAKEPLPDEFAHLDCYVFAGGNAHRDYDLLLATARQMPDTPFVIATRLLDGRTDLPANVTARTVPHRTFMLLMEHASAVVVPMARGLTRAAGQQTYLNAMWMEKPTVITRAPGVGDHVEHGRTGWIVDSSPDDTGGGTAVHSRSGELDRHCAGVCRSQTDCG